MTARSGLDLAEKWSGPSAQMQLHFSPLAALLVLPRAAVALNLANPPRATTAGVVASSGTTLPQVAPKSVKLAVASTKTTSLLRDVTTVADFETHVRSSERVVVCKYVKTGCRSCRALTPKFEQIARDHPQATFVSATLSEARELFVHERLRLTPCVLIYCSGVGRLNGFGQLGSRSTAKLRTELQLLLHERPRKLEALRALRPAALQPLLRYAAVVDALRAARGAAFLVEGAFLLEGGTGAAQAEAAVRAMPTRHWQEARELFTYLARGDGGKRLTVDDLVAATRALVSHEASEGGAGGRRDSERAVGAAGLFAPLHLESVGVASERQVLEGALAAFERAISDQPPLDTDPLPQARGLTLNAFLALMALHRASEKTIDKASERLGRAVGTVLSADGGRGCEPLPLARAAARIEAAHRALARYNDDDDVGACLDIEGVLRAFDLEEAGVTTVTLERILVRRDSVCC